MKEKVASGRKPVNPQVGARVHPDLMVEIKVLAARQRRRLNDVVEEALEDLLKKYPGGREGGKNKL